MWFKKPKKGNISHICTKTFVIWLHLITNLIFLCPISDSHFPFTKKENVWEVNIELQKSENIECCDTLQINWLIITVHLRSAIVSHENYILHVVLVTLTVSPNKEDNMTCLALRFNFSLQYWFTRQIVYAVYYNLSFC